MPPHIIVIGAGLAGAAASAKLGAAGCRVTVIEARDRAGGRGYAKPFPGEAEPLEMGGAWIAPWHARVRALAAEHGLALRPRHAVASRLFATPQPAGWAERQAHERVIARVAADALLLKQGSAANEKGEALRGVSFAAYLDRLAPPSGTMPAFTRALFSAWWVMSGNADHGLAAASEFLASCVYADGLAEGMIESWADTVTPGIDRLAERLIAASGANTLFSAPVSAISSTGADVEIVAGDTRHAADAVVVALGLNQMRGITFTPALPAQKRDAIATGHGGASFKLWVKMQGVPVGTLATGDGSGIEFAFAERLAADGTTLVVAFGLAGGEAQPGDPAWVAAEMAKLIPNARYIAHDWHDWVADPYARGTWVAALAGREAGVEAGNWLPIGRIAFASSDYAPEQAGWFEGAVICGERAARDVLAMLARA
ncbi:MAG: flavin monoamine oxidase family protein [Rhizobiaceae bacterium]